MRCVVKCFIRDSESGNLCLILNLFILLSVKTSSSLFTSSNPLILMTVIGRIELTFHNYYYYYYFSFLLCVLCRFFRELHVKWFWILIIYLLCVNGWDVRGVKSKNHVCFQQNNMKNAISIISHTRCRFFVWIFCYLKKAKILPSYKKQSLISFVIQKRHIVVIIL